MPIPKKAAVGGPPPQPRLPPFATVEALWNGHWHPALILEGNPQAGIVKVEWLNAVSLTRSSWHEWVNEEDVRPLKDPEAS